MKKFCALFGLMLISLVALTLLTTHRAAAAPQYCFMLGDPANGKTANNACLAGQTAPPELHGLSRGMSSASLANAFINDINTYAGKPYPVDRTGAAYVKQVLQQRGGNWATNLKLTTLTVENVPAAAGCANTAYNPANNSVVHISDCQHDAALVARQNGVIVFAIRVECGNVLGNFPGPQPNRPPTGSFTSLVCNTAAATYTISVRYSDPDAATTAQLRGVGGAVYKTSGGTSVTWTISTETLEPEYFPVGLWVRDVGPGASGAYKQVATHAIANCGVQGSIVQVSCTQVSLRAWDQNDPDDNVRYYIQANGAAKSGPTTFGGKDAAASTRNVSGIPGFDYWIQNKLTLWGVDTQTGAQTNLGTATLPICGHLSCGGTTLPASLVAGQPITFKVWVAVAGAPNGPPGAKFTSIRFDTLNTTSPYVYSSSDLYSNAINYTPQAAGTYNLTWTFGGGESNPPSVSCSLNNIRVSYVPYFTVVGGDASAGQGFGAGCTTNTAADIAGETLDTGGKYFGASSRQAAIATGQINQFATDTTNFIPSNLGGSSDGINSHQPSGLAFANTAPSGTTYGGGYVTTAGQAWCVPDYAGGVTGTTATFLPTSGSLSGLTPNADGYVYRLSGDKSINGNITLKPGVHITILVTGGNVYLNSNVTYSGYSSLKDIPQFTLIDVGGNIYVDHNVDELHGTYIAQPTNASNGMLFTCATGLSAPSTNYGTCNNALTFYGAVSAGELVPGRMAGNLSKTSAVSDVPGEQFVYGPELWLGSVDTSGVGCEIDPAQAQCLYQSYTSLPPVF